jgi:hypothetical protein
MYPLDEVHALLIFAAALDRDAAFDKVSRAVATHGWRGAEISRSGELPADLSTVRDSDLRASAKYALDHALDHGCSVIAYRDPL